MSVEVVDTLVVGAGQAGVAMSEHLGRYGIDHLVLERDRIAERWRTGRWDSLVANGPAWHDRFPGAQFEGIDPDSFAPKEVVADYFVDYARNIGAPIRCGVEARKLERVAGDRLFRIETSACTVRAANVVVATGPFQCPLVPDLVPAQPGLVQMHSSEYHNPDQLNEGAVIVVGAGSSGVQIAEELMEAGREVYLSVGPHDRPPRSYRGRDFCWWLGVLGKWDASAKDPGTEHVTIAVSGARGGHTIDFRQLAARGMTLVGRTQIFTQGKLHFAQNLRENLMRGDENYLSLLDEADAYLVRNGIVLPEEPQARAITPDSDCIINPLHSLDLAEAGIGTIIWATGFTTDYSWMKVDAFDANGRPRHHRGVSHEPGIYFLGLPWQTRRASSFIWGVWHDAKYIADQIATQDKYLSYHFAAEQAAE